MSEPQEYTAERVGRELAEQEAECTIKWGGYPPCPMCDGLGLPMGRLGNVTHYRCRHCGWTFDEAD